MILLICDGGPDDHESAVEGIFELGLIPAGHALAVYFDAAARTPHRTALGLVVPHRHKRTGLLATLRTMLTAEELAALRTVIVRNWFPVLRQLVDRPFGCSVTLGFWETFPHGYRRVYQAELAAAGVWRKRLAYTWNTWRENRLLARCDFHLPISATFAAEFRPDLRIPIHPVPMGIRPELQPSSAVEERIPTDKLALVYLGTVDPLRQLEVILSAVDRLADRVTLDLYTAPTDYVQKLVAGRPGVRLCATLPRAALLARLPAYDLGLSLIPDIRLYRVASPTKTMEYALCGLPSLMTPLPEHLRLFPAEAGYFAPMETEAIMSELVRLGELPRAELRACGRLARVTVMRHRNYPDLAADLVQFLADQDHPRRAR